MSKSVDHPSHPSRRAFLRSSLGTLAATPFLAAIGSEGSPALTPTKPRSARDILILGAGMSGLTAALSLLRCGHNVTVIEYQDRAGGRLLSLPLESGQFTEAGGGHFRSNMPYVLSYIRHFGLPVLSLNDGLPRYFYNGKTAEGAYLQDWPWDLNPDERNVSVATTLNRYLFANDLDADTVLAAEWPDPATRDRLDDLTVGDLIRRAGGSDAFIRVLDAHGGTFTSRSAALGAIPDLAYHFGDQNLFRIRGGNDQLPKAMARVLGDRVNLDAQVTEIDQSGDRVKVVVKDGREFTGDAVVCTIPFTVLQDIKVTPAWSEKKMTMFQQMEWDKTVKVITQTKTPAWLAKGVHGWPMAGSDRQWERVIDITGNEPGGHGNVFFYLNGDNAEKVLAMPKEERARATVEAFRSDMPDLFDEVIKMDSFAWTEQPWIKASFGGPGLGGAWMIAEWTKPEGRIHFAGDFTTMKSGWVEGAIESGLRAARQIDPAAQPESSPVIRREPTPA